jgi:hypothetical protein
MVVRPHGFAITPAALGEIAKLRKYWERRTSNVGFALWLGWGVSDDAAVPRREGLLFSFVEKSQIAHASDDVAIASGERVVFCVTEAHLDKFEHKKLDYDSVKGLHLKDA